MMKELYEKELSRLIIKAFDIRDVQFSDHTSIENHTLYITEDPLIESERLNIDQFDDINEMTIKIIRPYDRNIYTNSIMDIIPISTKALGKIGEGITYTLLGVCVCLTGIDESGEQIAEFGSSEGVLNDKMIFHTAGTPNQEDIVISVDFVVRKGAQFKRESIKNIHYLCDQFIQIIREKLKKLNGKNCDEKHEYVDVYDENKIDIAVIKEVAGQGAMYDTLVLPDEPSGFEGGRSIIDMGNMPVVLTPNEYRDGAIRAMC